MEAGFLPGTTGPNRFDRRPSEPALSSSRGPQKKPSYFGFLTMALLSLVAFLAMIFFLNVDRFLGMDRLGTGMIGLFCGVAVVFIGGLGIFVGLLELSHPNHSKVSLAGVIVNALFIAGLLLWLALLLPAKEKAIRVDKKAALPGRSFLVARPGFPQTRVTFFLLNR